ncbi:hypothetical protein A4G99_16125 [Haladaptatus sp. R4]|nr:hypothetical protein A4G99_16125 [Haladaptatus sp. R4]
MFADEDRIIVREGVGLDAVCEFLPVYAVELFGWFAGVCAIALHNVRATIGALLERFLDVGFGDFVVW